MNCNCAFDVPRDKQMPHFFIGHSSASAASSGWRLRTFVGINLPPASLLSWVGILLARVHV